MTSPPTVQKLMQNLGAIIVSIPSNFTNKLNAISTIGDFFTWQEERIRKIEGEIEDAKRRVYNIEVKNNCDCFCRKV
jgi:hypothetical protein